MPAMDKAKYLNYLSRYALGFAFFEYSIVAANLYYDPAFNLGQVGAVDPILEGITSDEVYDRYAAILDERTRRVTYWNLIFVRVGAIMQSALGFCYGYAISQPFKNRFPFHCIYCYVGFMMSHIDFSYGLGLEVGTSTQEKYGYGPDPGRLNNIGFMLFLLVVHGSLAVFSFLDKKAESNATEVTVMTAEEKP
jgi:hypothetical protein